MPNQKSGARRAKLIALDGRTQGRDRVVAASGKKSLSLTQLQLAFAQIPRQFADNAGYSNHRRIS
jgi:hypothetical protein